MDTHEKEFPRNFLRTINEFADWLNQHVDCAANKLVVHWSRHWDGDGEYLSVRVGAFDVWSGRDTPATVFCLDNLKATFLSHVEGLWNRPCVQQALAPVVVEFLEATIPDEKEVLRKLQDDTLQRYLPMTINQPRIVPPRFPISHGLYELYWSDEAGGGSSLAAVGSDEQGNRWYAPTNWISDVPCFDWTNIAQARLVESKVDKDETVPGESQVDYAAYMASVEKLYQYLGIPKRIFEGREATVDEAADPSPAISRHWSSESLVLNHSKGTVEQASSIQDATVKAEELPEPASMDVPMDYDAANYARSLEEARKWTDYKHKTLDEIIGECQKDK